MGDHHRVVSLSILAITAACAKKPDPAPLDPRPATTRTPVDTARAGEMAEGLEKAFGLPIPRRMRISRRFGNEVFALGEVKPEHLANYVREHVAAQTVETGPVKTVFARATVKGSPERPLRIEVTLRGNVTELLVRDETRTPATDNLTPEERWKQLGLTPNGRPIDPTHLD